MTRITLTGEFAWAAFGATMLSVLMAWADPVSGLACNAAILSITAAWLFRNGWRAGVPWVAVPIAIVPVWGAAHLAMGWTPYPHAAQLEIAAWLASGSLFYLAFSTLQDGGRRELVLSALLCCGALLAATGILQWFTAGGRVLWIFTTPYTDEVMATFLNRDHYAVFVELILPIALYRALFDVKADTKYAVAAGFLYASVVTTGSRAGTAMVTMEAVILIALSCRQRGWALGRAIGLAGLLLLISTAAGWEYVWFRLNQPDLFAFRREMALATIDMIRAEPWTGFGLGQWQTVYPGFALFDPPGFYMNHAHNDWLEWTSDGGIPFLLCGLAIAIAAIKLAKRNWWAFGVPVALLHAGFDFPMHKQAVAAMLFYLLGAAAATSRGSVTTSKRPGHRRKRAPLTLEMISLEPTAQNSYQSGA